MSDQNTSNIKDGLDLLFKKPLEPFFAPYNKIAFQVHENYLTERYKKLYTQIIQKNTAYTKIDLDEKLSAPTLSFASKLERTHSFSLFNATHQNIAAELINLFLGYQDVTTLISAAAYAKDRLNPMLFQYALSVAVLHRPDTKEIYSPPVIFYQFPFQFIDSEVIYQIREENAMVSKESRNSIKVPKIIKFSGSEREPEERMAYFREDICVNMHHWHWHLTYPTTGNHSIVNKDRRGELFYYMHNQIMARYNTDRFANKLRRTIPLNNFRDPIVEGYYSKIMQSANSRTYPGRTAGLTLKDLNNDTQMDRILINDLELWRQRINQAIDEGILLTHDRETISLKNDKGIDLLGNIVEASSISTNYEYYGNIHNLGHVIISMIHDPDNLYLSDFGVMAGTETAMRDPAFYRWHEFINDVFVRHKKTLPPYSDNDLENVDIIIKSVNVKTTDLENKQANDLEKIVVDELITFWQKSDVDITSGLDFDDQEDTKNEVFVEYTHLQHYPFRYEIDVINNGDPQLGTLRIFLLPKVDERNTTLSFSDQHLLAIEMDKYTVNLEKGENHFVRNSTNSSVIIPFEQSIYNKGVNNKTQKFYYCGCGWPEHMLVPKGQVGDQGQKFDLFVMISMNDIKNPSIKSDGKCIEAYSYCGLRDKLYPDSRPMGYPFDRKGTDTVEKSKGLKTFVSKYPNMYTKPIQITHRNKFLSLPIESH